MNVSLIGTREQVVSVLEELLAKARTEITACVYVESNGGRWGNLDLGFEVQEDEGPLVYEVELDT